MILRLAMSVLLDVSSINTTPARVTPLNTPELKVTWLATRVNVTPGLIVILPWMVMSAPTAVNVVF